VILEERVIYEFKDIDQKGRSDVPYNEGVKFE
jgi:hypothetical protein